MSEDVEKIHELRARLAAMGYALRVDPDAAPPTLSPAEAVRPATPNPLQAQLDAALAEVERLLAVVANGVPVRLDLAAGLVVRKVTNAETMLFEASAAILARSWAAPAPKPPIPARALRRATADVGVRSTLHAP